MGTIQGEEKINDIMQTPDIEDLRSECVLAGSLRYSMHRPRLLYFNPAFQVFTDKPSAEFLTRVFQRQRQWISQFHQIFPRHRSHLRCVTDWPSVDERTQYEKFLSRSACFTGMMFFKGRLLVRKEWEQMLIKKCEALTKGPSIDWIAYKLSADLRSPKSKLFNSPEEVQEYWRDKILLMESLTQP